MPILRSAIINFVVSFILVLSSIAFKPYLIEESEFIEENNGQQSSLYIFIFVVSFNLVDFKTCVSESIFELFCADEENVERK